ncbi:MAG: sensor histidine kinase KdpD [Planctomyces sp.]|nr:sensor histidine kinase KdpD [Planctomyces sp.]
MSDQRPNPDELLANLPNEDHPLKRGVLKIFFGYAAGVGKTYSMLEAAQREKAKGREVVIGYVEPHARPETQALVSGIEALPVRESEYRGVRLREFDLDAALVRHPEILLVDELAHTNIPDSRHEKRWQDIEELVNAGIHVWTTLNVQHIESLNDVIGQITGIQVRETIPDQVFDSADELELIDITPAELMLRLKSGKVYLPDQAQHALQKFFQKSNLAALRELSMRQAARRVHSEVESARKKQAADKLWATSERLLVCIGPSPTTARVIRTARRMATALDAPWLAVSVDLFGTSAGKFAKDQIAEHFRLAEQLGAETVTLNGQDVSNTLLDYARSRNVTKILIGKTNQPRWRRFLTGTVVDDIIDGSGNIDVYVIQGDDEGRAVVRPTTDRTPSLSKHGILAAGVFVSAAACLNLGLSRIQFADSEANTVMVLLAAVAWTAFRHGRIPAIVASVLSVLLFDFLFVPPYFTFRVADAEYLVTFTVMLAIALVISTLTSRLKAQIESSHLREQRTAALYDLGKQLSSTYGQTFLSAAAGSKIRELCHGDVAIYLSDDAGAPELIFGHDTSIARHYNSSAVAQWVIEQNQIAGAGTGTLPSAVALFVPLMGSQRTIGAMAINSHSGEQLVDPENRRLLEAATSQLALALERDKLAIEASEARIQAETERVRSSLLSSVSHDLRTPLASIAGASSSLLLAESMNGETQKQLLETVAEEAARLNRLLENILQMSKLDAGASPPNRQWHVLEEIIGSALQRTEHQLRSHKVSVDIPHDLPLLFIDGLLIEQVFVNLFENIARHTPSASQAVISAVQKNDHVRIIVADDGPGLKAGSEERIFEKFYRSEQHAAAVSGSGLGLAICQAILKAHGGSIHAATRPAGGTEFVIVLALRRDTPTVVVN